VDVVYNVDGSTPDTFNTAFQELPWNFVPFMNSEQVQFKSGVCYNERCYNEQMLQRTNSTTKECYNERMLQQTVFSI